jgi:hypothetical protein
MLTGNALALLVSASALPVNIDARPVNSEP